MSIFSSEIHTHLALAVPKQNGAAMPLIKCIKVNNTDAFSTAVANLLCNGETIEVGDKVFYLISHLSIVGKKYGDVAIINKTLDSLEMEPFNSNLDELAKKLTLIKTARRIGA